jgi:hypothetical protein
MAHVARVAPALAQVEHNHIPAHQQKPVYLHRVDIRYRRGPFAVLNDPVWAESFNADLLRAYRSLPYVAVVPVIDKEARSVRESRYYQGPYHYALAPMLERFAGFLRFYGRVGNVIVAAALQLLDRGVPIHPSTVAR